MGIDHTTETTGTTEAADTAGWGSPLNATNESRRGAWRARRWNRCRPIALAVAAAWLAACASTTVTDRDEYEGGELPRPPQIIVYDFAATPEDIPSFAQGHDAYAGARASMTDKELATARKLGADVAKELVKKINDMGMTAAREQDAGEPAIDDIVLVGYFTTVDKGSAAERILIGFGEGDASVGVHAEGYHMTDDGLVLLGSGDVGSGGGKMPGLVVPTVVTIATANPIGLVVGGAVKVAGEATGHSGAKGAAENIAKEIAKVLEQKFREQGWI